jgi:cytochrome c556
MPVKPLTLASFAACVALGLAWNLHAQDEEDEGPYAAEIEYRQALMKSIGGHVVATVGLISDDVTAENHLKVHAAAIAGVSDDIPKFFPKDSTHEDSAAKPEIWQNWDDFVEKADAQRDAAAAYNQVVQANGGAEEVRTAFKKLTDTCKGCHEDYRKKD